MIVTAFKLANQAVVSAGGTMINPPPSFFATGMEQNLFTYIVSGDGLTIEDHIVGTTRMGTSSATAVVDGNLHVFGVKNLMIADIGVLPNSPNGNTCYSAYMVGLRACTILGVPVPPAR
jgi:choline dehydrogenase-like flavoprotein